MPSWTGTDQERGGIAAAPLAAALDLAAQGFEGAARLRIEAKTGALL
jgi:hypothetical protein